MKKIIQGIFTLFRAQAISAPQWAYPETTQSLPRVTYPLLILGFAALYFLVGAHVQATGMFSKVDIFFGSDVPWTIGDLAIPDANHYRTNTHPFYVLMLNPIGTGLNLLIKNAATTARLMTSVAGGCFVALIASLLVHLGTRRITALLLTLILGFSAGHLIWGAVPDTFLFDGLSLLGFIWTIYTRPKNFPLVIATAVIAFGMVTTHLPLVGLFYVLARNGLQWNLKKMILDGAFFCFLVLGIGIGLAIVQDLIYPSCTLFFMPHALGSRTEFIAETVDAGSIPQALLLLLYFFTFIFSMPRFIPDELAEGHIGIKADTFSAFPELFTTPALLATALWSLILTLTLVGLIRDGHFKKPFVLTLLACVAFNFVLHMNYGRPNEYFIYAAHWTLIPILLCGITFSLRSPCNQLFTVLLSLQLILLLWADVLMLRQVFDILPAAG